MRVAFVAVALLAMTAGVASACTYKQQNVSVDQVIADVTATPTPKLPQSTKKDG